MKFYAPKYKQLDLGLLRSSLDELDKTNRWVALGDLLPWTELEKEYNSRLDNQKKGAGNKPARMILGAMIIKHKLNLSDAETIEIIRESPYMQYFCGLHGFTDKPIFDPSLFVTIRKRISEDELNKMTVKLLNKQKRLLEEKRTLTAILKMYHQQEEMYRSKTHTCADRILSIFQPHVRAIVRGKAKARTEFGAKIGASIVEGYTFIDHHSWDAYNESQDLLLQIQLFKERFGYLPATILADKIYLNRSNRDILEDFEIHSYCKPLGRPPKDPPSDEMKSRMAKAIGERNEIECSFGTGKRIYRANDIRAKLPDTARCWTGMCYFVKNVMKFLRELCLALTEIWRFFIIVVAMRGYICYPLSVTRC